jgi:hypothetical protein
MGRSKNYMSVQKKISLGLVAVIVSTSSFDGRRIIKEHLNLICHKGVAANYVMLGWRAKTKMCYRSCV